MWTHIVKKGNPPFFEREIVTRPELNIIDRRVNKVKAVFKIMEQSMNNVKDDFNIVKHGGVKSPRAPKRTSDALNNIKATFKNIHACLNKVKRRLNNIEQPMKIVHSEVNRTRRGGELPVWG